MILKYQHNWRIIQVINFILFTLFPLFLKSDFVAGQSSFSTKSFKNHIFILGNDSLEGRATGSKGEKKAANYIKSELIKLDIPPVDQNGSYFQDVPMHGSTPLKESKFKLFVNDIELRLELGEDYLLYKTGQETFVPSPVPLVFVGYGIIAPEFDYNDYQLIDVRGKIVVYLSGEPYSNDTTYFDGSKPTIYSYPESKERIAFSRGARGSILIPNIDDASHRSWEKTVREYSFEDVRLAYSASAHLSLIINPEKATILFEQSPFTLDQVFLMHRTNSIQSFSLSTKLSFEGQFDERDFLSPNVYGVLTGKHPKLKDTYIIVSAHYDHLGIGPPVRNDSIYNGVSDNACGVAASLELARMFRNLTTPLNRSIIFLYVTGEEKGLLGSIYYLDHPVVPLYKTITNLNIDGIAMFDTFNNIVGIGLEFSTLDKYLNKVSKKRDLNVSPIPPQFNHSNAFLLSDQVAFAQAGIPSILIMEGLNFRHFGREEGIQWFKHWGEHIYHSPFDDLSQKINYDATKQHVELLFDFILELANSPEAPEWKAGTPYINARLQTIAEKR